jgi:hypothetical protein
VDEILANMLRLAQALTSCGKCGAEQISPFCLEAMYRSGVIFAQRSALEGDEDAYESFKILKLGLEATGRRWKAGSKILPFIFNRVELILIWPDLYLDLLNARDVTGIL